MPEIFQISLVLFKIKTLIGEGKCSFEERREKNIATLAALGILPEDVFSILLELTPQNYYRGPTNDYDTGERDCIWEFGITVSDREIYVKLKLEEEFVKDISFHFAEREIEYPFRRKEV